MTDLQPDIAGYLAAVGTTNQPLVTCHSCQRALLYGAMLYAGAVKADITGVEEQINRFNPIKAMEHLRTGHARVTTLVQILAEFCKVDFIANLPGATDLSDEDWSLAIDSFFRARTDHYVTPDGKIKFEPHGRNGEPHEFGPEPDGVPV